MATEGFDIRHQKYGMPLTVEQFGRGLQRYAENAGLSHSIKIFVSINTNQRANSCYICTL